MMPSGTLQPRGMKPAGHCGTAGQHLTKTSHPRAQLLPPTIKTFKNHFKPQRAKTHSSLSMGKGWRANILTETTSCQGHQIGPGGQLDSENPPRQRHSQGERLPALPILKPASFCSQLLGVQEVGAVVGAHTGVGGTGILQDSVTLSHCPTSVSLSFPTEEEQIIPTSPETPSSHLGLPSFKAKP